MKDFKIKDGVLLRYEGDSERVEVPEGIVKLGSGSFLNSKLSEVVLPKSLKEIGFHAFYNCKNLKSADLSGVAAIGDKAFFGCSSLESLVVGKELVSIGSNPVMDCKSLKEVRGNGRIENGCISFGKTLVSYVGSDSIFEIPEGIEKIAGYSFCGCEHLQELVVPEWVSEIADFAFANCTKLRALELKCRTLEMGPCIFFNCPRLMRVKAHKGLVFPGPLDRQTVCDKKFMRTLSLSCLGNKDAFEASQTEHFERFLKEEKEYVMDYAIEAGDVFALLFYLDNDLLSEEELRKYLKLASELGRAECVARLLAKTTPQKQEEKKLTDILGEW